MVKKDKINVLEFNTRLGDSEIQPILMRLEYETGAEIFGLEDAAKIDDTVVFHAGTAMKENAVVTSGA